MPRKPKPKHKTFYVDGLERVCVRDVTDYWLDYLFIHRIRELEKAGLQDKYFCQQCLREARKVVIKRQKHETKN